MFDFGSWLYDLGISYIDYDLLWIAFTHRSYKGMGYEGEVNERFEFLGDAVLDLVTAAILFADDRLNESEMTELRKIYVNNAQLAVIFDRLQMEQFIRAANNLKLTEKIKAGFVEAFFGVIYLEKGFDVSVQVWQKIQEKLSKFDNVPYSNSWNQWSSNQLKNSKTSLQEFCQSIQIGLPEYQVVKKKGPDHNPTYTVKVIISPGSNKIGFEDVFDTYVIHKPYVTEYANGRNIKLAERRAAEKMCDRIGLVYSSEN